MPLDGNLVEDKVAGHMVLEGMGMGMDTGSWSFVHFDQIIVIFYVILQLILRWSFQNPHACQLS